MTSKSLLRRQNCMECENFSEEMAYMVFPVGSREFSDGRHPPHLEILDTRK